MTQRPAAGSDLTLHVFFDGSVLDLFINDEQAASIRIYPTDTQALGASIFSAGATHIRNAKAWILNPQQSVSAIEAVRSDVEATDSRVRFQIDPMTHQLTLHQSLADGRMLRLF